MTACERSDNRSRSVEQDVDNTGQNVRDRDMNAKTPFDQSESQSDLDITQKIRRALMDDDSLSVNAKNIKIMTNNGVVTLRGPVENSNERDSIARKVKDISGVKRVDNQLEVKTNR
ncbi:MAG: BON domain-containing protein [Parachlamydiaceae bacterium]|nr:MAG: BON domain-containing protein [Parachlamydiaceae bacterium]